MFSKISVFETLQKKKSLFFHLQGCVVAILMDEFCRIAFSVKENLHCNHTSLLMKSDVKQFLDALITYCPTRTVRFSQLQI